MKSAYTTILDDYFSDASFFKPTGDGLLVVLDYDENTLQDVVAKAVSTSVQLVEAFPTICATDQMVNFEVPGDLGIGLARGAATRLSSGDYTLDYSGRPLNLAARLMDIARPSGVVFGGALGADLLPNALGRRFREDEVYIKGLAEDLPMRIHYLSDRTVISDTYRRPIGKTRVFAEKKATYTVRELEGMGNFRFALTKEPLDRSQIQLVASHPDATPSGKKRKGVLALKERPTTYGEDGQGKHVRADLPALAKALKREKVKSTWIVTLGVEYAVADDR